jgi:predicted GIY-YIG superfamily endonuclease
MTVYLLHFDQPISPNHTCQHYLGWADDWQRRIEQHRRGQGSRLCQVAQERNIDFTVVRLWIGDRSLERQLKRRKASPRLCPICSRKWSLTNL